MTYQDEITTTADRSVAQVLAARASWQAGTMTTDAYLALIAAFVSAANSTTAAIADLSLSAALTVQTGQAVAPLGLTRPADDLERLTKAAATLAALEDVTPDRWERLARSEPLEAAANARPTATKVPPASRSGRGSRPALRSKGGGSAGPGSGTSLGVIGVGGFLSRRDGDDSAARGGAGRLDDGTPEVDLLAELVGVRLRRDVARRHRRGAGHRRPDRTRSARRPRTPG